MKDLTKMTEEELHNFLLNAPHNPNRRIRPGWDDIEITDEAFNRAMDVAEAVRKSKQGDN